MASNNLDKSQKCILILENCIDMCMYFKTIGNILRFAELHFIFKSEIICTSIKDILTNVFGIASVCTKPAHTDQVKMVFFLQRVKADRFSSFLPFSCLNHSWL